MPRNREIVKITFRSKSQYGFFLLIILGYFLTHSMPAEYAMLLTMHYQVFYQVELFSDQVINILYYQVFDQVELFSDQVELFQLSRTAQ